MFAVTRQDIINDDLSALSQIPMRLGRGAAIGLNMAFWTEFLANLNTFYTSAHGNVSTGAGSALSSDGLKNAQLKFLKQTDPNGDPLGVDPRILLVPPELEITADELMTSLIVNTGGSSTTEKVPNRNGPALDPGGVPQRQGGAGHRERRCRLQRLGDPVSRILRHGHS